MNLLKLNRKTTGVGLVIGIASTVLPMYQGRTPEIQEILVGVGLFLVGLFAKDAN